MRRKEDEVEALKKELEAIDRNAAKGAEEKKRLREQYEEKVKRITSQLIALKRQRWEQESQRLERQKAKSDVKVSDRSTHCTMHTYCLLTVLAEEDQPHSMQKLHIWMKEEGLDVSIENFRASFLISTKICGYEEVGSKED